MIVVDPSPAADASRGQTDDWLVEAIDLLPSFVEVASPAHSQVRSDLKGHLFDWMTTRRERATISNESVAQATGSAHEQGYLFGFW